MWRIKGYRVIDIINPLKWWAIIDAKLAKRYSDTAFIEQLAYRMSECPECVADGRCRDCKCPMPNAMLAKNNTCSEGRWPKMMSEEQWKVYKKVMGIKIEA